jgi:hypothetical protein
MSTIYDLLRDHCDLNVLIGPPQARAWKDGPTYITFVNGRLVEEGETPPHVGTDLERADVLLPMALYNTIVQKAETLGADTVIIRMNTEDSPVERHEATFSHIDNQYYPARYICRTRVAFTNLAKGSHND